MLTASFLLTSVVLALGIHLGPNYGILTDWPWLLSLVATLAVFCFVVPVRRIPLDRARAAVPVIGGTVLLLSNLLLDRTLAAFVGGSILLLLACTVQWTLRKDNQPAADGPIIALMLGIGVTLALPLPQVNRIVIDLPGVAVPTHFGLFEDERDNPAASSMYYRDMHQLSPLSVELNARHGTLPGRPMPWLRVSVVRDSNVVIERLHYQSGIANTYLTLQTFEGPGLHKMVLGPASDEVRLQYTDKGIVVDQIAYAEEGWLSLPSLEAPAIDTVTRLSVVAARLILWAFVCGTFLLWRPTRRRP